MKFIAKRIIAAFMVLAMTAGLLPADWALLPGSFDARAASSTLTEDSTVLMMVAGENHILALMDDYSVWAWGQNQYGQLGDGYTYTRTLPYMIISPSGYTIGGVTRRVSSIIAGGNHSLAILEGGYLIAWGNNRGGQLGDGTTANRLKPVPVMMPDGSYFTVMETGPDDEPSVSAGFSHTMAIRYDGLLCGWGDNTYGQLGNGNNKNQLTPSYVKLLPDEKEEYYDINGKLKFETIVHGEEDQPLADLVAAGYNHTVAYANGEIYTFGNNTNGQLGTGDLKDRNIPFILGEYPDDQDLPDYADMPPTVSALRCGNAHSMVLAGTDLYGWGSNFFGQIDLGSDIPYFPYPVFMKSGVDDVQGGYNHNVMLLGDTVFTSGFNARGQLGNGTFGNAAASYLVEIDDPDFEPVLDVTDPDFGLPYDKIPIQATRIVAGYFFSGLIDFDDKIWLWGDNGQGQLGDGTQIRRTTPNYLPMKVFYEDVVPVTNIQLDRKTLVIGLGPENSKTLTATLAPENVLYEKVTWTSSNPNIAVVVDEPIDEFEDDYVESEFPRARVRIVGNGRVGTATITATSYNGKTAVCTVTVRPDPVSVEITSKPARLLAVGTGFTMKAKVSPSNTYNDAVEWAFADDLYGFDDDIYYDEDDVTGARTVTCDYATIDMDTGYLVATDIGTVYVQARSVMNPAVRTVVAVECGVFSTGVEIYLEEYMGPYEPYEPRPAKVFRVTLTIDRRVPANPQYQTVQLYPVSQPFELANQSFTWYNSSPSTVHLNTLTNEITAVKPGNSVIVCYANDKSGKFFTLEVTVIPLGTEIILTSPRLTTEFDDDGYIINEYLRINEGKRVTLKGKILPARSSQKITWALEQDESRPVAALDAKGHLTALRPNETPDECILIGIPSDTPEEYASETSVRLEIPVVVIRPVTRVMLSGKDGEKSLTMMVEEEYEGLNYLLMPDDASIPDVTWTTSNPFAVKIESNDDGSEPVLYAVGPGKATITCTAADGTGRKASIKVTVKSIPTDIVLNKYLVERLNAGKTYKLKATVYPLSASQDVQWVIEVLEGYGTVAEITNRGVLRAVGEGVVSVKAMIKVGEDDYIESEPCEVHCFVPVTTIKINPSKISMIQDSSVLLTVEVSPPSATNKGISMDALAAFSTDTYTGDDDLEYIELNENGMIELFAESDAPPGTYSLNFYCDGKKSTVKVTVYTPPLGIEISGYPEDGLIYRGKTYQLKALVDEPSSDQNVTWVSTNEDVATIDKKGKLKATGGGETTIYCYSNSDPECISDEVVLTCKVPVSSVKLESTNYKFTATNTLTLVAGAEPADVMINIFPADAYIEDDTLLVEPADSRAEDYISLDYYGDNALFFTVTPEDTGVANVKVSAGGKTVTLKVLVKANPDGVTITTRERDTELIKGTPLTLSATVEPSQALQKVYWESDNEYVATVSTKGKVTVKSKGEANIYAYTFDANGDMVRSDPYPITTEVPVTSLAASTRTLKLDADGESATVYITIRPAEDAYAGNDPEWKVGSYNSSIVSDVSVTDGEVTVTPGSQPGKCSVSIFYGSGSYRKSVVLSVTVKEPPDSGQTFRF